MTLSTRLKLPLPGATDFGDHAVWYDPALTILDAELGFPLRSNPATYIGQVGIVTGATINGIDAGQGIFASTNGTTYNMGPMGRPMPLGQGASADSFPFISPSGPSVASNSGYIPISNQPMTFLPKSAYRIRCQVCVQFLGRNYNSNGNMKWLLNIVDNSNGNVVLNFPMTPRDVDTYDMSGFASGNLCMQLGCEAVIRNTTVNNKSYSVSVQTQSLSGTTFNFKVLAGGSTNGETFIHYEHVGSAS